MYASISDKYGKLLMYFDGVNIYNGKHELMKGKQTGLSIGEVLNETKAAPFIIPLGNCKYYIVHDGMYPKTNPNQYGPFHLVDMASNDGEGEVKEVFYAPPNSDIMEPNFQFDFTNATLHANGRDIWLFMSDYEHIYSYLIEYATGTVAFKNRFYKKNTLFDNRYYSDRLSFSPKGDYFYTYNKQAFNNEPFGGVKMDLMFFDNVTGKISPLVQDVPHGHYVQFWISRNGNYWYYYPDFKIDVFTRQFCRYSYSNDLSSLKTPLSCWGEDVNKETSSRGVIPVLISPNNMMIVADGIQSNEIEPVTRRFYYTTNFSEIQNIDSPKLVVRRNIKSYYLLNGIEFPNPSFFNFTPRFISNFFDSAWVNRPLPSTKAKWEKGAEQCVGQSVSFKIKEDLPGESIRISWGDGTDTIVTTLAQQLKHAYTKSGKYQIQVVRKEACAIDNFKDTVMVLPTPTIKSNPDSAFLCSGESILAKVQNPMADFVYSWSNGQKGSETELKEIGSYTVSTSNRCGIAYDTVFVKEGSWQIPNVFTPNGDGVNDTWNITSKTTEQAHVKVLNRWGSVVYESEKYENDWEANNVSDGIYFYQITQNEGCQYKGWVQVIR